MAMAVQCSGRQAVALNRAGARASAPVLPVRAACRRAPLVVRAQAAPEKDTQVRAGSDGAPLRRPQPTAAQHQGAVCWAPSLLQQS